MVVHHAGTMVSSYVRLCNAMSSKGLMTKIAATGILATAGRQLYTAMSFGCSLILKLNSAWCLSSLLIMGRLHFRPT